MTRNSPYRHRPVAEKSHLRDLRAIATAAVDAADVVAAHKLPRLQRVQRLRCPHRVARPAKARKLMPLPK
jgi:hypothetical protein